MAISVMNFEPKSSFDYRVEDGVAHVVFDIPGEPVNTLSPDVGDAFDEVLRRAAQDEQVRAVVLSSGKKDSFIAGAKIELVQSMTTAAEAESLSRKAQEGFNRLESFEKPVVAAIHGSCLGGGLEWALACRYRIASSSKKTGLGVPETQLGLLPGAGGTQRLPRLVGAQAALDLILTGKTLKPSKAKKLGLVDEVVPQPILLEVATRRAKEIADGKLSLPGRGPKAGKGIGGFFKGLAGKTGVSGLAWDDNPVGRKILFDQARKQLLSKTKGKYPAPEKALAAVRVGLDEGMEAGLSAEARAFGELVVSDVSRRLVEIFFATTALKKDNGTSNPELKGRKVEKVAVLGGGLMGAGIAYVSAANMGVPVRIKEKDDAGAGHGLRYVRGVLEEKAKRKSITSRELEATMAKVSATTELTGFKQVDLVIEAVFEDVELKHRMIRDVEAVTRDDCIFASNTSSIPITRLAEASKHPETVIGMHYFSPVHKMPLLEIITHKQTADWVVATCVAAGKRQGKTVIVVNDGVGFYTSRILGPYMNEAAYLLAEGADIAEIDAALVAFGYPVGPIMLLDEVGIDVAEKAGKIMHQAFGERMAPPEAIGKLTSDGRLGRKTKKGFYTYDGKEKRVDETVYALLPHGTERKHLDAQEMAERVSLQMVNEAIHCLGEGVLRSARDGDVGAIFGLGFPPFLGGPFRWADQIGAAKLLERMEHWHEKLGQRFEPAPLLVQKAKSSERFYPDSRSTGA